MISHVMSLCATCYEMLEAALTWWTLMVPKEPLSSIVSIFCELKRIHRRVLSQTFAYQTEMMTQSIMSIRWYKKVILLNVYSHSLSRPVLSMTHLEYSLSTLRRQNLWNLAWIGFFFFHFKTLFLNIILNVIINTIKKIGSKLNLPKQIIFTLHSSQSIFSTYQSLLLFMKIS